MDTAPGRKSLICAPEFGRILRDWWIWPQILNPVWESDDVNPAGGSRAPFLCPQVLGDGLEQIRNGRRVGGMPTSLFIAEWIASPLRSRSGATFRRRVCLDDLELSIVISTLSDFEDATAFERYALARATPILEAGTERPSSVDLRQGGGNAVLVVMPETARVGGGDDGLRDAAVRPLFFGAAWKVLDLLMELAFWQANLTPKNKNGRWSIAEKKAHASAGHGVLLPLTGDAAIWSRIGRCYANTDDARHSLVHRGVEVDPTTGALTGKDDQGQPIPPIDADTQAAFCRVAQHAAKAAIDGGLLARTRSDFCWHLDQLASLHREPLLAGTEAAPAIRVLANPTPMGSGWDLNPGQILADAQWTFPAAHYFDLELYLPHDDSRYWSGDLESAPSGPTPFDPDAPPSWLTPS